MPSDKGGVRVIEVTMTTPGALKVIEEASARYGDDVLFGAGTVLDTETARAAILAGAGFIVAPTLKIAVIELCRRYNIPVMPGCYTPTEMLTRVGSRRRFRQALSGGRGRTGDDQGDPGAFAAASNRTGGRCRLAHDC